MTGTSNQTLIVTLVVIIGTIVLVALHDITAATGIALIGPLAGVHLGANTLPVSATTEVTPVTGNTGK